MSSGRIDLAISSITITDERLKSQAFTQGYYDSDMALATAKEVLGLYLLLAVFLATLASTVWNFTLTDFWVFGDRQVGRIEASVNGEAHALGRDGLQGTLRARLIATDRGRVHPIEAPVQ